MAIFSKMRTAMEGSPGQTAVFDRDIAGLLSRTIPKQKTAQVPVVVDPIEDWALCADGSWWFLQNGSWLPADLTYELSSLDPVAILLNL
jgi:hypothetical protein